MAPPKIISTAEPPSVSGRLVVVGLYRWSSSARIFSPGLVAVQAIRLIIML
jgi:hypothetical protein